MALGFASWLLLLAAEAGDLIVALGDGGRPRICSPAAAGAGPASRWDQVLTDPLVPLCRGLARGQIRLGSEPGAALELARRLAGQWPERPEPRLLEARALVRLGQVQPSLEAWQAALELARVAGADEAELLSPHALRDRAIALALAGQAPEAARLYRRVVSLRDAWPDPRDVQRLYLEAAAAALRCGPDLRGDALGYLAEAQRGARSTGLRALVAGLRALARLRPEAGQLDAGEVWHVVSLARAERLPPAWPALPQHELHAIASLLVEEHSLLDAAELWQSYVDGLKGTGAPPALLEQALSRNARLQARSGGAR